jgi:hypothetical protein
MEFTKLSDTLNAAEGTAFITINGSVRRLFELSNIKAQLEYVVTAKRMLGSRMTQHKVVGLEGTGSLTMYFANSQLLHQALSYLNGQAYTGITIKIKNEDPASTIGTQEVALYNCILNTVPVAALDDSSDDPITFDTDFTFDGIEPLSSFSLPKKL